MTKSLLTLMIDLSDFEIE